MIKITSLEEADFERWRILARGYMAFYKTQRTDAEYLALWRRMMSSQNIVGLGARMEGELVGFAHYLFHASAWSQDVCYLQDLFVDEGRRGLGVARALIAYIAQQAQHKGSPRLYWLTHQENARARVLYDKVAAHQGFIRYERSLL
jgi:GNAT superfamily N-acetyltransferase